MEREVSPHPATELEAYIYDYLITRNLSMTAEAFVEETKARPSATDPRKIDVPRGFLSDWWSIFWESFTSGPRRLACQKKPLEVGDHFSQEEEHMQQRAATLANSNRSSNVVVNHGMHQVPAPDSYKMHSQQSLQTHGMGKMDLHDSPVYNRLASQSPIEKTAPMHIQQPYQQPPDGKCADDMLDLSEDIAMKKTIGFAIEDVFNTKASSKKIFCCDFSSNGSLLASAGEENKVFIWNLRNNLEMHAWEAHCSFITDISFSPKENMLATASSDRTVKLWDTNQGYYAQQTLVGHSTQVRSVEFHPKDTSILCSCDDGGKVFIWKIGQLQGQVIPRVSKAAGKAKVRFHSDGKLVASAVDNTVHLADVELDKTLRCFQDCARVWSAGGQPVRELSQKGYFRSCSFHPRQPNTLLIGGYETITLWNIAENKVESVQSHDGYVSDLEASLATGLLASASHDGGVKVWRC